MTLSEAYEFLDLPEGTDIQQVRARFSEQYSEYRMQIDNAPTPNLRQRYEQNLALREEAFNLITGGASLDDTHDLPSSAPYEQGKEFHSDRKTNGYKENSMPEWMSFSDALTLLGLKATASPGEIETAYLAQKAQLELESQNARIESIKEAYKTELNNLEQAWAAVSYSWGKNIKGLTPKEVDGKWGYIDITENVIIDFKYEEADSFWEGKAAVKRNGKWGYIDETEKVIIDFKYEDTLSFDMGMAWVKQDGKWGNIDRTEKVLIDFKYEDASHFFEVLAAVKLHSKWGYIDKTGKIVIDIIYDEADLFFTGIASVEKNGECFTINKLGERVIAEPRLNEERGSPDGNHHFMDSGENKEVSFIYVKPFTITVSAFIIYIILMMLDINSDSNFMPLMGPFWFGVWYVTFIFSKKNNLLLPFLKTSPNLKATLYTFVIWIVLFPLIIMALGATSRL